MCAVPPAARRQIRIGAGREGEHGRDQLDAEEEKENDAKKTSHREIVASPRYFFLTSPRKRVLETLGPASKMTMGAACLWPVQLRKKRTGELFYAVERTRVSETRHFRPSPGLSSNLPDRRMFSQVQSLAGCHLTILM